MIQQQILRYALMGFLLCAGRVAADERILDYHSHIEVQANADLLITETITVQAEGREIKRGIYRDFPTDYKDRLGNRYVVDFEVQEVLRDGVQEAFHTQKQKNGTRVYVGREAHFLPAGTYTYTLMYRSTHQLGFFEKHDELYFNAIGSGWEFPIDHASVQVVLPQTIPDQDIQAEGYTGAQGSKDRDIALRGIADGRIDFEVTRGLNRNEGVTVVVAWPKGHVKAPGESEKMQRLLANNRPILVASIGFLLVGGYFLLTWMWIGRDPEQGVIIPEFHPPQHLSAAAARFVMEMKYDHRCFACALISSAVKGHVRLEEEKGKYTVTRTSAATTELSKGESRLLQVLLGGRPSIELKQSNHSQIRKAVTSLKTSLKEEYEGRCFKRNTGWLIPGFIGSVLTIAASFLLSKSPEGLFLGVWLSFWSIGVYFLVRQVWTAWTTPGRGVGGTFGALFSTLFALPFVGAELVVISMMGKSIPPLAVAILVCLLGLNVLFYHLIKQPTLVGRKLMDHLEGFKLYLAVAESERFEAMQGPEKTPELFEAYLPYALALGVEQEWSEQFSDILAKAGQAGESTGYRPMWHHGSMGRFDTAAFAGGLGGALAAAVASSSTAPGSSSGGGGGGFSGGGGGGGGGGGW